MKRIFRIVAAAAVVIPSTIYIGDAMYCQWNTRRGKEKLYDPPDFDQNDFDDMRQHQNIVDTMKKLFELKTVDRNTLETYFKESVTYEDPYMFCKGREEVLKCFLLLPTVIETCETTQFFPQHHRKYIQVVHEHTYGFKLPFGKIRPVSRKGNLILELETVDGKVKVERIFDEWNGKAIPGSCSDTTAWYMFPSQLIRRLRTKWYLFYLPYTDTGHLITDKIIRLLEPVQSEEEQAIRNSLNPPAPKYSSK